MACRLSLTTIAVLSLTLTAGAVPTPIGSVVPGGSWGQRFREFGVGDFDSVVVQWRLLTPPSAEAFEPPTFRDLPGDWTISQDSGTLAVAAGASRSDMIWSLWFTGDSSAPLAFDFVAFSGPTQVDRAYISWSGRVWTVTALCWTPPGGDVVPVPPATSIPAPSALVLSVFGSLGVAGLKRRGFV